MDKEYAKEILMHFLSFPLTESDGILGAFASLPNAEAHFDGKKRCFVYVPGSRPDRVLLLAHADTVWDSAYGEEGAVQTLAEEDGILSGKDPRVGIGADDRAGCAMLWLLRESGHSLLVLDGEEGGLIGSTHLSERYPALYDELNRHSYMLQLDRRGATDYKVYRLPVSREFRSFIEEGIGYRDAGRSSATDIVALCRDICGVNLSVGYANEHSAQETLSIPRWLATLEGVERLLTPAQRRYPLLDV